MVRVFESNIQSEGTGKANAPRASGRWFNLPLSRCVSTPGWTRRRDLVDDPRRIIRSDHALHRQDHCESRAFSIDALREHVSPQGVNEFPGDAETQTGAAELAGPRLIHLPEVLPDGLEIDVADTDPRVT